MKKKMSSLWLFSVLLTFTLAACNVPSVSETNTPQPAPVTETPAPAATSIPTLTLEQLKNAAITINGNSPDASPRIIQLANGKYEPTTDRASADYVSINMGEQVAYGDLNDDGVEDAAIIIGENYGGTGTFVSVVALLNQNGQPIFAASSIVDDRPIINALSIENGEILLNATTHGPNDPGCCPAQPVSQTLRLWGGKLVATRHTSKTPNGSERIISIHSPAQDSVSSGTFTIDGSVTIAPFENSLAYRIFVEGVAEPIVQSAFMVSATEMGGPGTFSLPLDLTEPSLKGKKIRIEINEQSMADGSSLTIASLFVIIQ